MLVEDEILFYKTQLAKQKCIAQETIELEKTKAKKELIKQTEELEAYISKFTNELRFVLESQVKFLDRNGLYYQNGMRLIDENRKSSWKTRIHLYNLSTDSERDRFIAKKWFPKYMYILKIVEFIARYPPITYTIDNPNSVFDKFTLSFDYKSDLSEPKCSLVIILHTPNNKDSWFYNLFNKVSSHPFYYFNKQ